MSRYSRPPTHFKKHNVVPKPNRPTNKDMKDLDRSEMKVNSPHADADPPKQYLRGGVADKNRVSDFNKKELDRGTKVEREHTNNPGVAREIATDHLKEDPQYYKKLEKMEKPARKKTWFEQQTPAYQAKVKREERYYNTSDKRYEQNRAGRKVLYSGHDADLVSETPTKRVWVSRVSGEIERERLENGRWVNDD